MRTTVKGRLIMGALVITVMLPGCAGTSAPPPTPGAHSSTISSPKTVGRYKVGKPYQIQGTWYQPEEDFEYEEVGMASWYGKKFHGRHTANGEIYDMNDMTAAHRTLPLPSIVRVTNLDNGRTVKLRVNDRGPFAKGRIIDVSRQAAQKLGFKNKGVTKVRVEVVADESRMLAGHEGNGGPLSNGISQVGLTPDPAVVALNRQQLQTVKSTPRTRTVRRSPVAAPAPTIVRRAKTVPVTTVADNRTYIQAGAFSDRANAHRVRSRLSGLGPVEVRELQVNGHELYRVRLGPLSSDDQADRLLGDVIRAGYPRSHIVSE